MTAKVRGEGSIIQLEKEKPKSRCRKWQLRVSVGYDERAKDYKTRTKRFTGTWTEAQNELRKFVNDVNSGKVAPVGSCTVAQYADEYMSLRMSSGEYAHGTLRKNIDHIKCIKKVLGGAKLCAVTPLMIEKSYAELRNGGGQSGRKLSGTYVNCIHMTLRGMFDHAKRHGLIDLNPCESVKPPRTDTPEKKALKPGQINEFVKTLDPTKPNEVTLLLCVTMGIRRGEAAALTWEDVDFRERSVSVTKSIDDAGNVKTTKTKASIRKLPMPGLAFDALRTRKVSQQRDMADIRARLANGGKEPREPQQRPDTPIVSNVFGEHVMPHSLSTWWRRNRAEYGMDGWTIHELRHSYLTALAIAGVHPKVMQKLAGHASSVTTMDIYNHIDFDEKSAATEAFENAIAGTNSGTNNATTMHYA